MDDAAFDRGRPPGPPRLPVLGNTHQYVRDPLGFFVETAREYGPVAYYDLGGEAFYQLSDPDHVERVLVHENESYVKGELFQDSLRPPLGNGLLTNEGDAWRRQRHRIQPAFTPDRLAAYATVMVDLTERRIADWDDGEPIDLHEEMMRLTVEIAAKALFDVDVRTSKAAIGGALEAVMDQVERHTRRPVDVPSWAPTPGNRQYARALATLDAVADRIIDERRSQQRGDSRGARSNGDDGSPDGDADDDTHEPGDVVTLLLDAGVSREQIRDEVVTILLAGHETTALALTYALHLLASNPDAWKPLREELDDVLADGPPAASDLPALAYTERVVKETMRVHPPVYELLRESIEDVVFDGYRIPAGNTIAVQQWVIHRDPANYDEPSTFRPDRWTPEFERSLPRFAYFPFGGGPRRCIGDRFAMQEAQLVLATICRRWTFESKTEPLSFSPSITLRPSGPVEMVPRRR